jgi:hypothetical protein
VRSSPAIALCLAAALATPAPGAAGAEGPVGGLDNRAWELVSPAQKNGGEVGVPGTTAGGVLQAAASGGAVAFGSDASFGQAQGAPPVSQYLATRGSSGWLTTNLSPPLLSGTYEADPYLLFSEDLSRGILTNGWSCRDGSSSCEAQNPPLGPGGPAGYRNLYLREGSAYTPLITTANSPLLTVSAEDFRLSLGAASPDLSHVVTSTCAALVAGAVEVPGSEGCDPEAQNIYLWTKGQHTVVNKLPAQVLSAPGASISNLPGSVSEDGTRVYWSREGNLYLRDADETKVICEACSFQGATGDGGLAFYLKTGHLHRYESETDADTDLTPAGGVVALIALSVDAQVLYWAASDGLYRRSGATATKLFGSAPAQLPPQSGRARASADGSRLFLTYGGVLHPKDTNQRPDVYEWEAEGTGNCATTGGCFGLLSDGNGLGGYLAGASASGDEVFFTTASSLLPADPGANDLYVAKVAGGFPEPPSPFECEGDDCQGPAPAPEDPTPGTATVAGRGNPPLRVTAQRKRKRHHHKRRHRHRRERHHNGARQA